MKRFFTSITTLLISATIFCQSPVLVKDINTNTAAPTSGSNPANGLVINGHLYFAAADYQGREPWKTDGTGSGTIFLKDIVSFGPGASNSSNPHNLVSIGNTVYFFIGDSSNSELWKIISTDTVKQVVPEKIIYPHDVVTIGSSIFFSGKLNSSEGQELLRFDTSLGFIQSYDIRPGSVGSDPQNLTVKGDTLYFSADTANIERELWIYDINGLLPQLVSDINSGADPSNPTDLVVYNGLLYFSANSGADGVELFVSDGVLGGSGTFIVAYMNNENGGLDNSNPSHKTVFNNKLIFSAADGLLGTELWQYDDATLTATMLADINSGTDSSLAGNYGFHPAGSFLYFAADDGTTGMELWKTDGLIAGTTAMVADINAGGSSNPQSMNNLTDTLIFVADDGNGPELWRSKAASTVMIQDIQPNTVTDPPTIVAKYNNKIYFGADNGTVGKELFATNGLSAGTALVKDIHLGDAEISSNINWFEPLGSEMFFNAMKSPTEQKGLYKTTGSTASTVELVPPGGATNFYVLPEPAKAAGSLLFFRGHTTNEGDELWVSDGSLVGTSMVKDIRSGTNSSDPGAFAALGTSVVFRANDGTNGAELWISNGTLAGTTLLKNINPTASTGSSIDKVTTVGSKVFFVADDGTNGAELWVTDGTGGGTTLVKNINGTGSSNPSNLTAVGSLLYFFADDGTNGMEPWVSDGTLAGTFILKNINAGAASSNTFVPNFCSFGSFVYFGADDGSGSKLWRTNGTSVGTTLFNSIEFPILLTNVGSKMVFFCLPGSHPNGYELYGFDGTTIAKIKDFGPYGLNYMLIDNYPVYVSRAFFWLDDNVHGQELWGTSGTTGGTTMYEIAPGPMSSYPRNAKGLNPLLFSAYDGTNKGNELWRLDVSPPLPISGLEFNARKKDETKALLEWKTYTEFNNKGFEIERSVDGRNFTSIGFVNARGIGSNGATYEFIDASPIIGKNYYRLKQTDIDGKFTYSPIRWVDFGKEAYVKAYPNPTTDVLNIASGYNFKNAQLSIRNVAGQLVKQTSVSGSGTISIPVKDLAVGVYTIEITEGSNILKLAFVKQ